MTDQAHVSNVYGAKSNTFVWLGAIRLPGMFVEFCNDMLVSLVPGIPAMSTVNEPVTCREGPITIPDATPVATPALSPLVIGIVVLMLCTGMAVMRILYTAPTAMGPAAMFG
jgi:hypothetical protein